MGRHLASLVMASGHREHTRVSTAGPNFDHPILEGDLPDWALNAFDEFAADSLESEFMPDTSDTLPAAPSPPSPASTYPASTLATESLSGILSPSTPLSHLPLARLLSPHPRDEIPGARRILLPTHRASILCRQWGVPCLPPPALLIFGPQ